MKSIQQKRIEAKQRAKRCRSLTTNQRLKALVKAGHGGCREAERLHEKLKEEAKSGAVKPEPAKPTNKPKKDKRFDRI